MRPSFIALASVSAALLALAAGSQQRSTLSGHVRDFSDDSGIPGVRLRIERPGSSAPEELITDADGHYSVPGLPLGVKVSARFRKGGYLPNPETKTLEVSEEHITLDVVLMRQDRLEPRNRAALIDDLRRRANRNGTSYQQEVAALEPFGASPQLRGDVLAALTEDVETAPPGLSQPESSVPPSRFAHLPATEAAPASARPPRIAVLLFENEAGSEWWSGERAEAMQALWVTELAETGDVQVVERDRLPSLLRENALSLSGVIAPEAAVKAGVLLGVDYLLIGAVTEYGTVGSRPPWMHGLKDPKPAFKAAATARLIDTETGATLWADEASSEFPRTTASVGGFAGGGNDQRMFDSVMKPLVQELVASMTAATVGPPPAVNHSEASAEEPPRP